MIDSLQTKCTEMVKLAEQAAEERLAKERVRHEQSMEDLGKKLARQQTGLKELEKSLALEKASRKDTKVIISKEVETIPLKSHHEEPLHLSSRY